MTSGNVSFKDIRTAGGGILQASASWCSSPAMSASLFLLAVLVVVTGGRQIVIGHRGAPGYRPEHTFDSYGLAIDFVRHIDFQCQLTWTGR